MRIYRASCAVAAIFLSACTTLGGAPEPSFDIQTDLKELARVSGNADTIENFSKETSPDKKKEIRNGFVSGRMMQIDLRYLDYVRNLTASKQQIDTSTQIAVMTLGIAGTLTGGAQAKSNLAAGVTTLAGAATIIDKNYFFDKSIDALVATMSARRKEVLATLLPKLNLTVDQYSLANAIADLVTYYEAGTLQGAIRSITVNAVTSEANSDKKIQNYELAEFSLSEGDLIAQITQSIGNVQLTNARTILAALAAPGTSLPAGLDEAGAKQELKTALRDAMSIKDPDPAKRSAALDKIRQAFIAANSWVGK